MSKAPLPDRNCSTKLKRQAMIAWVNRMLDRFQPDERPYSLEQAMRQADKDGDTEPLRQVLLQQTGHDLGRFLRKPKRAHGQHFPKTKASDPVTEAAIDAKIIWWLWRQNYPKKLPIGVNAVKIAAARHRVSVDAVINKGKKISFNPDGDFGVTGFLKFPRGKNSTLYWWDAEH